MMVLANGEGGVGMAAAVRALQEGRSALDAIEAGIRPVEADPAVRSVGVGGAPNLLGQVECDAAIMDGTTLRCGAVGALQGYLHPVSVARQVMERLPHVLLVGEGAARFAREVGAERAALLTDAASADYLTWLQARLPEAARADLDRAALAQYAWPADAAPSPHGTTVWLAVDAQGHLAGGTSTSGWAYKYPGRLGDSPIIGAGLYVDGRYGGCACTHVGEMAIRAGTSRAVVLYMKKGASVEEACREAMDDLSHLAGGYLGSLIIHAIDREGRVCVVGSGQKGRRDTYWLWRDGMVEPERRQATDAS